MKTLLVVASVVALGLIATAVALAANNTSNRGAATVKISTRSVTGLGTILVDSRGRTLYMFVPDKHAKVTCHGTCAKAWPPIFVPAGAKLVAAGSAKQSLLGMDKDSTGGNVATYNHWPLYLFVGDRKAGQAIGQALNVNGGLWYVMSPTGAIIKKKPSTGGGGGATGGGGGATGGGGGGPTTTTTGGGGGGNANCSDDDGDGDGNAGGPDDGDGCL